MRLALTESDLEEIVKSAETLDQALELLIKELIVSLKKAEVPYKKSPPKNKIPRDRRRLFNCISKLLRQLKKGQLQNLKQKRSKNPLIGLIDN